MKRMALSFSLLFCIIMLTGCNPADMVDSKIQAKAREYFPLAEIVHPRQGVLQINTYLSNITEKFASQVMRQLIRDNHQELELGLPLAGYDFLAVYFDGGYCTWSPTYPAHFGCTPIPETEHGHVYQVNGM